MREVYPTFVQGPAAAVRIEWSIDLDLLRMLNISQAARDAIRERGWRAVTVLPFVMLLGGCQSVVSTGSGSQLRIIQASSDAPGLDFYVGSTILANNIGFGSVSSYVPVNAGTYTISADTAGTTQALASVKQTFASGTQYTVLVGDDDANLQETVLQDQSQPAPSGQIALRFIDQNSVIGGLDVYLVPSGDTVTEVTALITALTDGNTPAYINVPTGTYKLVLVPTGTVLTTTTTATYTGAEVTYSAGSATTFVLVNQQLVSTPGVQVITATDYISPTATS